MASYRSHQGTTYATRTNTTINAPAGIQDGDEIRLYFILGAATAAGIPTPTFPAGFSTIGGPTTVSQGGNASFFSVRSWLLAKTASSEGASYTITHASASSDGIVVAVSSASSSNGQVTTNSGSGTGNITFTGLTTLANDAWLGAFCHNWQLWGAGTPPNGTTPTYTERQDSASSLIYFAEGTWASNGATGSPTKDSDNNVVDDQWAAMLCSIENSAPSGPQPICHLMNLF